MMLVFGFTHQTASGVAIMFVQLFINGWVKSMDRPPTERTMVHWWLQMESGGSVAVNGRTTSATA